jgi:2,3-bisphosphoglycerate-independent phosphoglycerate mutase
MNFANADMVGHSGKWIHRTAVEVVDACLGESMRPCDARRPLDHHRNAESMIDPVTKGPHTSHDESGAVYCGG